MYEYINLSSSSFINLFLPAYLQLSDVHCLKRICYLIVKFMTCDIKDFFLSTPIRTAEYMKIHFQYFPEDMFSISPCKQTSVLHLVILSMFTVIYVSIFRHSPFDFIFFLFDFTLLVVTPLHRASLAYRHI